MVIAAVLGFIFGFQIGVIFTIFTLIRLGKGDTEKMNNDETNTDNSKPEA